MTWFTPKNVRKSVNTAKKIYKAASMINSAVKRARSGSTKSRSPRTIKRQRMANPFIKAAVKFNTTGRSAGKFKRGTRRYANKNWVKQKYGVSLNKEAGKVYTASECVFLGHATAPLQTVREMMWRAIVKRLYIASGGYDMTDMHISLPQNTSVAVFFHNDGSDAPQQVENYLFGANNSLEDLVQWLGSQQRVYNDGENETRFYKFIRLLPSSTYSERSLREGRVNLMNCYLNFSMRSSYKIQNRSINSATWSNEEADNVDNVPLYGKSYEGSGNGAIVKNAQLVGIVPGFTATPTLFADYQFGIIEGGATQNSLKEPPYASDFMFVKRSGRVRLEPGAIKTSTLRSKGRVSFLDLQRQLAETQDVGYIGNIPTVSKVMTKLGQYRFFGLEKMIDAQASFPMTIATEHNLRVDCWSETSEDHYTVQITEKDYLPGGSFV